MTAGPGPGRYPGRGTDTNDSRANRGRQRRMRGAARYKAGIGLAAGLAVALVLAGLPVAAQDSGTAEGAGGLRFTWGIDSRQFLHTNATLTPGGEDESFETNTRLSFGLSSVTPDSYFTLDAGGRLRFIELLDGGESTLKDGFVTPDLRLSWGRSSAAARIDTNVFWRETDLAQDRGLDDFDTLEGQRQDWGGTIAYRWGEDRRWGIGLRASVIDSNFIEAPGETDRRRTLVGTDLRLDLTEAMTLTFDVAHSRFEEEGEAARESTRVTADLAIARPDGSYVIGASVDNTPEGTRTGLTFGRSLDLPRGSVSVRLGATRGVNGNISLTGTLDWTHALPNGQITASLSRGVAAGADTDTETETSRVSLGLTRELTPRAVLTADFGFAESRDTGTGDVTRNGSAGVMVSYDIGQDWLLDAGIRHRLRDDPDTARAADNAVFLGLRKTFERQF